MSSNFNKRHKNFKRELRAYHDSINRTNRYSLQKIAGKLNIFEDADGGESYDIDRKIPNTALTVLKRGDLYAIGDLDGNPITEFKYQFIEGCLGKHDKVVRCITDDGKIEDFDTNTETIVEDACAGGAAAPQMSGMGVGDSGGCSCGCNYHEIDYANTEKQLEIPFLCGARIVDIGKRRKKRRRRR